MARTALLFTLLVLGSFAAHAQLKVGDGGLLGYHSDFRKRPVYFTGALGGSYSSGYASGSRVSGSLSAGLGYAYKLSESFYLGGEVWMGSTTDFRSFDDDRSAFNTSLLYGGLKASAFFTTGKKGRSFLKVSVPLYTSNNLFSKNGSYRNTFSHSASIAWIYFFKKRPDYVRPSSISGPTGIKGFSVDLRVGATYLATSFAPRLNYTLNRWELGVGTLIHPGLATDLSESEGLRFGKDYIPLTTSLGYTILQTERARLQIIGEVLWPLNRSEADSYKQRTNVSLYARYEHSINDRLSVAVELGPNFMRTASGPVSGQSVNVNAFLHGTVGVRYRLGK